MALLNGNMLLETNPAWDELFHYPGTHSAGAALGRFIPDAFILHAGTLPLTGSEGVKGDGTRFPLKVYAYPFPWQGRDLRVVTAYAVQEGPAATGGSAAGQDCSEDGSDAGIDRLRRVLANAPIVLFALDGKGRVTFCEGRGLEPLGINSRQAVGKSAFELCRHTPQDSLNLRRALSGEEFTATAGFEGMWFEIHFSPLFKGYDDVAGVVGVGLNITDRHKAAEALRRSDGKLRHARKMDAIGRVAAGVTRDFIDLLALLNASGESPLPEIGGVESQTWNLAEFRKLAERASQLKGRLSAIGRNQALSLGPVKLNRLTDAIDKELRRRLPAEIELVTALEPELGEVWADAGKLEQVIFDLIENARDAIPDGGQITLETGNVELDGSYARGELFVVPGPYVMLSISDTGIGMDEEVKSHLFEPYFSTKAEGKGLGLPAVYGTVKQNGGTLSVESEIGKGTRVRIYLPRLDGSRAPARYAPPAQVSKSARSGFSPHGLETILLVEDEEAVRTLIREILCMHGYEVLEARQGGEAILISQSHKGSIQLLLTDMVMANMSGRELAGHLMPLRPEMRVLFISGYNPQAVFSETWGMGGSLLGDSPGRDGAGPNTVAFLAKPFTPKTLAARVRDLLDGKPSGRGALIGHLQE